MYLKVKNCHLFGFCSLLNQKELKWLIKIFFTDTRDSIDHIKKEKLLLQRCIIDVTLIILISGRE